MKFLRNQIPQKKHNASYRQALMRIQSNFCLFKRLNSDKLLRKTELYKYRFVNLTVETCMLCLFYLLFSSTCTLIEPE
jgi:hypothetical protein